MEESPTNARKSLKKDKTINQAIRLNAEIKQSKLLKIGILKQET